MNILALDTSSQAASCALLEDGKLMGEFFANLGLTHSQTALPMVEALLRQADITPQEVDVFAVSTGPGSFTGLRIGLASIKGMAMAADKPCAGVSTLESLAANLPCGEGYVLPVMDARRQQFYTALFQNEEGWPQRRSKDAALSLEELGEQIGSLSPHPVWLVGDGAHLVMEALSPIHSNLKLAPERVRHQRAASVGALAERMAKRGLLLSPQELAPSYLRLSQAERERQEREGIEGKE